MPSDKGSFFVVLTEQMVSKILVVLHWGGHKAHLFPVYRFPALVDLSGEFDLSVTLVSQTLTSFTPFTWKAFKTAK